MQYDDILFSSGDDGSIEGVAGLLNAPIDLVTDKCSLNIMEIPLGSLNVPVDIVYWYSDICYELIGPITDYAF